MESLNMEFEKTAGTPVSDTETGARKYHFVNEYENRRTIDHDMGAYLVYEGGAGHGGRGSERFTFHWQGEEMPFNAGIEDALDKDGNAIGVNWRFSVIAVPYHMQDQYEEIAEMIKQALGEHGYDKDGYKTVDVKYTKPIPYEI